MTPAATSSPVASIFIFFSLSMVSGSAQRKRGESNAPTPDSVPRRRRLLATLEVVRSVEAVPGGASGGAAAFPAQARAPAAAVVLVLELALHLFEAAALVARAAFPADPIRRMIVVEVIARLEVGLRSVVLAPVRFLARGVQQLGDAAGRPQAVEAPPPLGAGPIGLPLGLAAIGCRCHCALLLEISLRNSQITCRHENHLHRHTAPHGAHPATHRARISASQAGGGRYRHR